MEFQPDARTYLPTAALNTRSAHQHGNTVQFLKYAFNDNSINLNTNVKSEA